MMRCEACKHEYEGTSIDCPSCGENQGFRVCSLCGSGLVGDRGIDPLDLDSVCTNKNCWGHKYDRLHMLATAPAIASGHVRHRPSEEREVRGPLGIVTLLHARLRARAAVHDASRGGGELRQPEGGGPGVAERSVRMLPPRWTCDLDCDTDAPWDEPFALYEQDDPALCYPRILFYDGRISVEQASAEDVIAVLEHHRERFGAFTRSAVEARRT